MCATDVTPSMKGIMRSNVKSQLLECSARARSLSRTMLSGTCHGWIVGGERRAGNNFRLSVLKESVYCN